MKAIVQDRYGSADVLELREVAEPTVGPRDVLVRVRAAGVDRGAWHLMAGEPYAVRLGTGLRAPRQPIRGGELAGVVQRVGAEVTGFVPGDEVFGSGSGTFAEYAAVREDRLAPKPAGLTFPEAAAVPVSGVTALQALRDQARLQPGQRVLVIGASGGVGSFAVQVAKAFGGHVTGVCSAGKVDAVRALGADEVIDYAQRDVTDGTQHFDVVLDIGGGRPLRGLRRALAPRGTLVVVGGEGGGRWLGMSRQLGAVLLSPFVRQRLRMLVSVVRTPDLVALTELIDRGTVRPLVDRTFPLAAAPDAVRALVAGTVTGKVVVTL
ncbi:NADPH:quinone reductase [Blastococcus aggregatus]|uniref:NADPH:quinone reductase n=1 Tax=Blastococcus aggregatus TaxID=38502 RepID=A0A285V8P1_9ACTN|nr:NAD(P)-dependent alcohol dehydrogenase [Blastococcus aggregatus]SOC49416.1 NADPH:quinone reductase [Blastococcus aggregatus]